MPKGPEQIQIPENGSPENPERRKFIKQALKTGVKAGIGAGLSAKLISMLEDDKRTKKEVDMVRARLHEQAHDMSDSKKQEQVPVVLSPMNQLEAWGEVRDMQAGVEAIQTDHYSSLMATQKGKSDLLAMLKNISKLDMRKIVQPYRGLGLPEELAYMIALQETRARNLTSHAGAKGMTGLMPQTIKAMGFRKEDAYDPYKANVMTAHYFATERDDRFGDNLDLLLHAYNAGGGLLGYTETEPNKAQRSTEGFYDYMQNYINERYKKIESTVIGDGYFPYTVESGDTLYHISERFDVPLPELLEKNGFTEKTVIHDGDEVRIPCTDPVKASKHLLRKPFEAIRYTPEVKAKYQALKELGYADKIELAMRDA